MNQDLLQQIRDRKNASRLKPVGGQENQDSTAEERKKPITIHIPPAISPPIPISAPAPPSSSPVSISPPLLPPTPPDPATRTPSPPSSLDIEPAPAKPKSKKKKKPKPPKVEDSKSINSGPQISHNSTSRSSYHTYNQREGSSFSSESETTPSAPFFLSTGVLSCIASLDSSLSILALYSILDRLRAPTYFAVLAVLAEGLGLVAASVLFWRLHKLPVKTVLIANICFLLLGNVILGLVYLIGYAAPLLIARFLCGAGSCVSLLGYSNIARLSGKKEAAHRTVMLAWQQVLGFLFGCLLSVGLFTLDMDLASLFDSGNVHAPAIIALLLVLLASLFIPQRTETKFVHQMHERSVTPNSIIEDDEEPLRGGVQAALLNNEEICTLLAISSAGTAATWGVLGAYLELCAHTVQQQQLDENIYAVFVTAAAISLTPRLAIKYLSKGSTRSVMGSIVVIAAGCLGFSDVIHEMLLPQAIIAATLLFIGFVCLSTQVPVALLPVASIPYFVILLALASLAGRLGGLLVGVAVANAINLEAVTRLGTAFVFMGLLTGFATLRPSPPRAVEQEASGQKVWLNQEL